MDELLKNKTLVKDGFLTSEKPLDPSKKFSLEDVGYGSLVEFILGKMQDKIAQGYDHKFLFNCDLALQGKEKDSLGFVSRKLSDVETNSRAAAKAFYSKLNLKKGDIVHLMMPNNTDFYFPVLASWLCQATVSPADPYLTEKIITFHLEEAKPKIIVVTKDTLGKCLSAAEKVGLKDTSFVIMGEGKEDLKKNVYSFSKLVRESDGLPSPDSTLGFSLDDRSSIVWSSGTTGRPKGIQHTFRQLANGVNPKSVEYNGGLLQTTCFFHAGGFATPLALLPYEAKGYEKDSGPCSYFFPVEALENHTEKLFKAIDKFKPLFFVGGTHHLARMAAASESETADLDLKSLFLAMPVGSNVPDGCFERLKIHFPNLMAVFNFYGMSEFGALICSSMTTKNIGQVAPGTTVKIVDPETGQRLGPNKVGEIMAKHELDVITIGYLNRPEENAKFFGEDGFFHTGDLGHYDEDGTMYFDGRIKELIKYMNVHLYPIEVEEVILKHPDVLEAGVYGKPDPMVQELVSALVVKKKGSSLNEEDLVAFVSSKVEDYKRLRGGVKFVDKLPRNPQGKILRRELGKYAEEK